MELTLHSCTDFRKVNEDRLLSDFKIGNAKFVSIFDLLKGYWQASLTERTKEISTFVSSDGLFQYKVMAFGMKNDPVTFQRTIHSLLHDVKPILISNHL